METKTKGHKVEANVDRPLATLSPVERKLAAAGFQITRVDPALLRGDDQSREQAEDRVLDLLLRDGYKDPIEAFRDIFRTFGITRFADKAELVGYDHDGTEIVNPPTTFTILQIVQRIGAAYKDSTRDDWALEIVTENGEPQVLTFGTNEGRDRFLTLCAFGIWKTGQPIAGCQLAEFPTKDGNSFYAVVPAPIASAMKLVGPSSDRVETIDQ